MNRHHLATILLTALAPCAFAEAPLDYFRQPFTGRGLARFSGRFAPKNASTP